MKNIFFVLALLVSMLLLNFCNSNKGHLPESNVQHLTEEKETQTNGNVKEKEVTLTKAFLIPDIRLEGSNYFFTQQNYSGERFSVDSLGTFEIGEEINIRSVKVRDGYEISFDFGSPCNAIDNGTFKFINASSADIFSGFNCDENFAKVRKVFIRIDPKVLVNQIILFEKPYLQGEHHVFKVDKMTSAIDSISGSYRKNFEDMDIQIASLQLPKNCKVEFFSDSKLKNKIGEAESNDQGIDKYFVPSSAGFSTVSKIGSFSIKISPVRANNPVNANPPAPKKIHVFRR